MHAVGAVLNQYATWLAVGALIGLWAVMQWHRKLPTIDSLHALAEVVNSRGGNILVLIGLTVFFFMVSVKLFYKVIDFEVGGYIKQDDAFVLMALQFVMGTMTGGFSAALLKTMNGESSRSRATDRSDDKPGDGAPVNEPAKTAGQ